MRKNILYLTTIAIIMLFGACSTDVLFNENDKDLSPGIEGTISLTATMPSDPTTRVSLEQDEDLAISLKWETGDLLQLVFVQGETKVKSTVAVKNISADGKNAKFDIIIPTQITGKFDLYGVYGGGGLSNENPTLAILPKDAEEAGSLASIQSKEHVMFYFASKAMEITVTNATVMFKNIGSLFSITLKNTGTTDLDNIKEARLVGIGGDSKWAYNTGAGGNSYNLITNQFQNTETAGNYISFKAEVNSVKVGESIVLWGWNAPLLDKAWPELKLELRNTADEIIVTSVNTKPAQSVPTAAGMSYYLTANWDGSKLKFKTSREPNIFVKTTGLATNDGTTWAKATTLSKALEMMEDGDDIHIAAGTYIPTNKITGGVKDRDFTFEINSNVTLIGGYPANAADGATPNKINETILSGKGEYYHVVTITAPVETGKKVIIKNLTMKEGLAGTVGEAGDGDVIVNGVTFTRSAGGGLSVGKSVADLMDCVISHNKSEGFGAGVHVHSEALVNFTNTDITYNENTIVGNGGGLWNAGATVYLEGCNISNNTINGVGGGVYNYDEDKDNKKHSNLYMYNCIVANNLANVKETFAGGGVYGREFSYTRIVNSTFYGNESGQGGAIKIYGSATHPTTADIINTTIYKNHGTRHAGGIETTANTTVSLYNTIITGNTSKATKVADNDKFVATTTKSYMIVGDKVLDEAGNVVAGKTFDPETMISSTPVNGTFMITSTSPAATMGMSSSLLQTLGNGLVPPIANDIITNDQLGKSRSGNTAMGAVTIKAGSEPGTSPKADMLDVVFNLDGTATDVSPMNHPVLKKDFDNPFSVAYNNSYKRNMVTFNPEKNGISPGVDKGSYYRVDYLVDSEFHQKLKDGHSFETLVKFDVDYAVVQKYETKFFSTQEQGGTGFLVANWNQPTGENGLTFLPNVATTDGGGSRWIWANSKIKPNGSKWYHLVGVWDKDLGKAFLYVNGELKSETEAAGFYRPVNLGAEPWVAIGGDAGPNQVQGLFTGSLAIARIYDKALTAAEAQSLWMEVKPKVGSGNGDAPGMGHEFF